MLCNFPLFAYTFNKDSYTKQSIEVIDEGYDGLIALVPKVTVSCKYDGKGMKSIFRL